MVVLEIKREREREIRVSGACGKRLCNLVGYLENDCTGFLLSVAVSWFSASYDFSQVGLFRSGKEVRNGVARKLFYVYIKLAN